ncbi:MAG: bifunctional (p)ppGpp synthetase/guanosine-3',5'-bis(diphosphate) 3'-pyrophosphohydrolase [Clostridia bacterium]|nr:bifunctional (p)ppGpp synthetase/guanosine-3',5'-bis(diphosphate) 3'-pyrophosphohydrolase [Clostridia bacterium]
MIYTPLTKKALKLCFDAHREQTDKTGMPYVFHPFHLAEQMKDELSTVCALLHDVIEDTEYTFDDLREMGFPESVIEVLTLLTHQEDVPYMDYVRGTCASPVAREIKLADLEHNSDLTRFDSLTEYDLKRNEKYREAIKLLKE